jgi:hypothetical protein
MGWEWGEGLSLCKREGNLASPNPNQRLALARPQQPHFRSAPPPARNLWVARHCPLRIAPALSLTLPLSCPALLLCCTLDAYGDRFLGSSLSVSLFR